MASQPVRASAVSSSAALPARSASGANPASRSARIISSASAALSSTTRSRSGAATRSAERRLVQQQPVQPGLGDGAHEALEVHGLDDVAVDAEGVAPLHVGLFAG